MLALRLEHHDVRLSVGRARHSDEVGPDALFLPSAQVVVAALPRRHAMPPLQRLLPVEVLRELPLEHVEAVIVHGLEEADLQRGAPILAGEQPGAARNRQFETLDQRALRLADVQIEADFAGAEFVREHLLRLLLDLVADVLAERERQVGAAVVDMVVGVAIFTQPLQEVLRDAGGLPRIGDDVGEAAREPRGPDRFVDRQLRFAVKHRGRGADVDGRGLAADAVGQGTLRVGRGDCVPVNGGEHVALIVQLAPAVAVFVAYEGQEDVLAAELRPALEERVAEFGGGAQHVLAEPGEPLLLQPRLDLRHRVAHVGLPAVDVALVERLAPRPPRVGLAHHAARQLREGALRPGVV